MAFSLRHHGLDRHTRRLDSRLERIELRNGDSLVDGALAQEHRHLHLVHVLGGRPRDQLDIVGAEHPIKVAAA